MNAVGIMNHFFRYSPAYYSTGMIELLTGNKYIVTPSVMEKVTTQIEEIEPEMVDINLKSMKMLMITFSLMALISVFVLFYEIVDSSVRERI